MLEKMQKTKASCLEAKLSSLEAKLQDKEEALSKLKVLDTSRIERIFTTYSTALKQFGAKPYALPQDLTGENFLTWVEGEFSSLEEVFTIAGG